MEELKKARLETEQARKEAGLGSGNDGDGAQAPISDPMEMLAKGKGRELDSSPTAAAAPKITGRGIDKRKRELEERRKALDAKRRKTGVAAPTTVTTMSTSAPHADSTTGPVADAPRSHPLPSPSLGSSSSKLPRKTKKMDQQPPRSDAADDFLAQLEADLRKG